MLTEIYIEALMIDEEAADQVWEAWEAGGICDDLAACIFRPKMNTHSGSL